MRTRRVIAFAPPLLLAAGVGACGGESSGQSDLSPVAAQGQEIATRAGCAACHGSDGGGGTGPAWAGTLGTEVELSDGTTVTVDEAYLTRAIADPDAEVRDGFSVRMPQNQLRDDEIAKVVAYIVELGGPTGTAG
jgi:cytochrome c oxidase subunit 2